MHDTFDRLIKEFANIILMIALFEDVVKHG